ncbi:hypothetical protein PRIPAC_81688, partial [Pristionchus pacificus]|uniref:Dehydrogenase n=1 Tax=Pristionchus pacificus TaxID=54126 RepID=A0A2A6CNS5_PRIPA
MCNCFKGGQFTERISAKGKVAVVTGANTGIGLETARELNLRGAKVYFLCRNEQRAMNAIDGLVKDGCDGSRLVYIHCDLASKDSVRRCAAELSKLESRIDIFVNNAGVAKNKFEQTVDGHEMTWAINHLGMFGIDNPGNLGPFLLTELLLPLIEKADEGRIVNVSSFGHVFSPAIDLATIDDHFDARSDPKSKLANVIGGFLRSWSIFFSQIMHARELTRRLRARGNTTVTANSLHPVYLCEEFCMFSSIFMKSWKDGAQTTLYCALSTELKGISGQYFS